VINITCLPHISRKRTQFPLKRRLDVPKGQFGQCSEREKYLTAAGIRTPYLPDFKSLHTDYWIIIIRKKYVYLIRGSL
jgi:hypothetical protein